MTKSGKAVKLPVKNALEFYGIRMESIGGSGAISTGYFSPDESLSDDCGRNRGKRNIHLIER
jgi:hypothetical protein